MFNYYAIGFSLRQHQERIHQFDPELEEDNEGLLRKITKENTKRIYRISTRLMDIFEKCPQVIPHLEEVLSARKIDKMNKTEVSLLKRQVEELLSQ